MNKRILLALLSMFFVSVTVFAQTKYTGKVVDANTQEAIPGAIVMEIGSKSNGVLTDLNGNFGITIQGKSSIKISSVGYITKTIEVGQGRSSLGRIELEEDVQALSEVFVIGSGLVDIVKDRQTPIAATTLRGPQLEEKIGNLEFPEALKGVPSVYATSTGGYGDGSFTVRGFDQSNVLVLVNGQPVNDMEWGGIYWSNWSGLADVASVVQQQRGLGSSKIGISSVGGTTNIVTKASDRDRGGALKSTVGNDGYFKGTVSYDSGVSSDGWAVSALLSGWRGDGYMDKTDGRGATYFISVGYRPNDRHAFNITATGAPQVHAQDYRESISTYEKYGYKYNSNWGYLDGKPFSFSTNFYHKPITNFNWDWNINKQMTLSTVLYGSWGYGGGSRTLGTAHYKLPDDEHGLIKVDDLVKANQGMKVEGISKNVKPWSGADGRTNHWTGKNVVTETGGGTVLGSSMNNHSWYGMLSNMDVKFGQNWTLNAGVDLRTYVGKHYRVVNDLLGADAYYDDKDVNTAGVFVSDGVSLNPLAISEMQNAQKVNRNYDSHVRWMGFFGQLEYANDFLSAFVQGSVSNQMYKRHEYFEVPGSEQWTGWNNIWGGNIKGGVNWKINRQNNIFVNAGHFSRQPFFTSIYPYSYTAKANVREDIKNEKINSIEGGYVYNSSFLRAVLNVYYTTWGNRYVSFAADVDGVRRSARTYINQKHRGAELELTAHPTHNVDIYGMVSYAKWTYGGTAKATIYDDLGAIIPGADATLYLDNVEIGGSPQFQTRLGARWEIIKGLSVNADWFYNDNNFASVNATDFTKENVKSLKMPAYGTVDGGISYKLGFGERAAFKSLMLRLNVNNILDARYIARGYSNIAADADANNNWRGINKKNTVEFGYGRTWNVSATLRF